ncbi:putative cyclin-A3-1 isoform X1 [Vigna unguiculata]|uniref:putative cyclin-A3-1 isoform X1 n=1 Tax=Vigna unguiculata TaxID=3917 RepID=UPI001016C3CF|nr:putative cyclin-A3-1 isoform X1 [Vigna unguiculata]
METRAEKRKSNVMASVVVQRQHPKKQRVCFTQPSNLPNFAETSSLCEEKLQSLWNNVNLKRSNSRNNFLPSSQIHELDVWDINEYLRALEIKRRPMVNYIQKVQRTITSNMRAVLMDWLVELAEQHNLLSDTLLLCVSYIDRKYEEVDPPSLNEFCNVTDNTCNKTEIIKMEAEILKTLNFEMENPTAITFLRFFSWAASDNQRTPNLKVEFLGWYFVELSLLDYDCIRFLPSVVAASALFLARFLIDPEVHPWTSSLFECSGYKPVELKECVLILHNLHLSRKAESFEAVREKYKQHKFKYVANLPSPSYVPSYYFEDQLHMNDQQTLCTIDNVHSTP